MKKIQKTFLILLLILFTFSGRIFASGLNAYFFDIPRNYQPNLPFISQNERNICLLVEYYNCIEPTEEEIQKARKIRLRINRSLAHKKHKFTVLTAFNNLCTAFYEYLYEAEITKDKLVGDIITKEIRKFEDLKKILNLI